MCTLYPDPPADMVHGVDEQVIMHLDRIRRGNPLPNNVIEDISPYQCNPSNLPGGIWYLVRSNEKKETESGLWREKGAALEILTGSSLRGLRTTLEFIEFQDAREKETKWLMHEYKLTEKGLRGTSKEMDSRALCRVFLSDVQSSNKDRRPNSREALIVSRNHIPGVASVVKATDSISERGFGNASLVNIGATGNKLQSEADKPLDLQTQNISEPHYMFEGDYLELDDLADPGSSSNSSDSSNCTSLTLDEYFDPYALLQELEDKNSQDIRQKSSSSNFSVTESVRPFEVVMQPATLESLVCTNGRQPPPGCTTPSASILRIQNVDGKFPEHTVKMRKAQRKDEATSGSLGVATSLDSGISMSREKEKAYGVKTKRLKKYFCFLPL